MSTEVQTGSLHGRRAERRAAAGSLRDAICEETVRVCLQDFRPILRAIVLTGSLARDEATFVETEGSKEVWGDVEFFLVFDNRTRLPPAEAMGNLSERIRSSLLSRNIRCNVGADGVHARYFVNLRPRIFAYELRTCGQVVWGDEKVLLLIPDFPASAIPREDAWRLLCNRMIEQLEAAAQLVAQPEAIPGDLGYRSAKLYMDMATSLLVFVGAYEPTYRRRLERLSHLDSEALPELGLPFPRAEFVERVAAATHFKLGGPQVGSEFSIGSGRQGGMDVLQESLGYARRLWRWELARLTGTQEALSDRELMRTWMRLQPVSHRLRGWLYVVRKRGWHRSWRHWPRWTQLAWRASPRYWVYAVASELAFRLPAILASAGPDPNLDAVVQEIRGWLPARDSHRGEQRTDWRMVASETAWNYHQFLEKTRA